VNNYLNNLYASLFGYNNTQDLPSETSLPAVVKEQNTNKLDVSFSNNNVNLDDADTLIRQAYKVSDIMTELSYTPTDLKGKSPIFQNTNRIVSAYLEVCGTEIKRVSANFNLYSLESNFIDNVSSGVDSLAYKISLNAKDMNVNGSDNSLHTILHYSIEQNLSVGKQTR
jgi:hypothetical protein